MAGEHPRHRLQVPPTRSGVARTVGLLEGGLRARGHDVVVVSGTGSRRLVLGEFRVSGFAARWPSLLRRLHSCDVVNVHGPAPTVSDVFFLLLRTVPGVQRPAVVYTHHSSIEIAGLARASHAYNEFHRRLVGCADRAVVSTESYRRVLQAATAVPISVVPWGVDGARFRHSRVRRRPHEPLRVLFVGQMRPYKGIDVLLRAVADTGALRLTLAGWGRLGERYRRACARRDDVCFVGVVPDDRLAWLYASHDVVVLPSLTEAEAYGLVLVEGMAAGCVPVASDLPGVRDVAGPTGLLSPPGDAEALRRQLLRLAQDRELLNRLSWGVTRTCALAHRRLGRRPLRGCPRCSRARSPHHGQARTVGDRAAAGSRSESPAPRTDRHAARARGGGRPAGAARPIPSRAGAASEAVTEAAARARIPGPGRGETFRRGALWLGVSLVSVSIVNYGYTASMSWVLSTAALPVFVAGQALLVVAGTVSGAATPWVLAHEVADGADDRCRRRQALWFGLGVAAVQGLVAAVVVGSLAAAFARAWTAGIVGAATLAIFVAAAPVGYLQGLGRFGLIAGARGLEVGTKVAVGVALGLVGLGAGGALAGFGVGALAVLAVGLAAAARDLRPDWSGVRSRRLWRKTIGLGSIQGVVAALSAVDVVLVAVLPLAPRAAASYQLSTILGRAPLFLSIALSMAAFTAVTTERNGVRAVVASALEAYLRLAIPAVLLIATLPAQLLDLAFPARYATMRHYLPYTAAAGALVGAVNLVTTFFQADERYRRCLSRLAIGLVLQIVAAVVGWRLGGIVGIAAGAVAGSVVTLVLQVFEARRVWQTRVRLLRVLTPAVAAVPAVALTGRPTLWILCASASVAATMLSARAHLPGGRRWVGR